MRSHKGKRRELETYSGATTSSQKICTQSLSVPSFEEGCVSASSDPSSCQTAKRSVRISNDASASSSASWGFDLDFRFRFFFVVLFDWGKVSMKK
jgi:hypothetical protein